MRVRMTRSAGAALLVVAVVVGIVGTMPAVAFGDDTNGERFGFGDTWVKEKDPDERLGFGDSWTEPRLGFGDTWDPPAGARGTGTLAPSEPVARPSAPNAVVIVLAMLALAAASATAAARATARRRRAVVAR